MLSRHLSGLYESACAAIQSILAHGFRSALTTLGIVIGVSAVLAVVAVMQGLSASVSKKLDDLGSNTVTLQAVTSTDQEMLGLVNTITLDEYHYLKGKVQQTEHIAARLRAFSMSGKLRYGQTSTDSQLIGTESEYQQVINTYTEQGRFISPLDDQRRRRVVVIGHSLIDKLNLPDNPIGEYIQLQHEWLRIIGVAEKRGRLLGFDQDNYIIVPLSTIAALSAGQGEIGVDIVFAPKTGVPLEQVTDAMRHWLRHKRKLGSDEPDFFEFETAEKTRQQFSQITDSITLVAAGVVGISLLVGGIGIMNIMLVSVTERTREIGIAKALGATSNHILTQFLVEAVVLALFGGAVGVLLGYFFASIVFIFMPVSSAAIVPLWAIGLALGFSLTIGIVFGIMPAYKASRLDPIDALRHE